MEVYARGIHNFMTKPFYNCGLKNVVDSVTYKVLIIDTKFRSFIPLEVRKMPPKLCHICGYELCIIPKDMNIDLNIFRTIPVAYLQHIYVGRHTCNSLFITTSSVHYKYFYIW